VSLPLLIVVCYRRHVPPGEAETLRQRRVIPGTYHTSYRQRAHPL